MTRGRIYLIDAHKRCIASMQFSGDMYIEPFEYGHGAEIISAFRRGIIFDERSLSIFILGAVTDWYMKEPSDMDDVSYDEFSYSDSIVRRFTHRISKWMVLNGRLSAQRERVAIQYQGTLRTRPNNHITSFLI